MSHTTYIKELLAFTTSSAVDKVHPHEWVTRTNESCHTYKRVALETSSRPTLWIMPKKGVRDGAPIWMHRITHMTYIYIYIYIYIHIYIYIYIYIYICVYPYIGIDQYTHRHNGLCVLWLWHTSNVTDIYITVFCLLITRVLNRQRGNGRQRERARAREEKSERKIECAWASTREASARSLSLFYILSRDVTFGSALTFECVVREARHAQKSLARLLARALSRARG